MNIGEELYRLFCLPKCTSCQNPLERGENVLCDECMKTFKAEMFNDCSFCFEQISRCTCTPKPFKKARIRRLFKISRYFAMKEDSPTKSLVFSLKHENISRVISFMANELASRIRDYYQENASELVIVPIPRRKKSIVKYGYDHALVLSRRIAKILGCQVLPLLKSLSGREQKGLTREERVKNIKFKFVKTPLLKEKTVLIVDDIVTTGSSMIQAAKMISTLKPKQIVGACFAVSYRDLNLNSSLPF